MQTDKEFILGLSDFTKKLKPYLGEPSNETLPDYYREIGRYTTALEQFGLINRSHLVRFVLGTLNGLLKKGHGLTPEATMQLEFHYNLELRSVMKRKYAAEDLLTCMDSVLLPVTLDQSGCINAITVINYNATTASPLTGQDLHLAQMSQTINQHMELQKEVRT